MVTVVPASAVPVNVGVVSVVILSVDMLESLAACKSGILTEGIEVSTVTDKAGEYALSESAKK